ncbi:MAG: hypothetical protein KC636_21795, partial [Myxococcales bacterium]|nr:hypothetical protein [Myxococcales bacterium]
MSGAGRRVRALVGLLAGLALAAAVVWWLAPDGRALVEYMSFQPGWIALAAALILAGNLTTSARWKLMTEAMGGTHLPLVVYAHGHALLRVVGQLSSTLLVDLLARGAVLRAAGSTRGHGHAITQAALERLGDILLPLIVLAWGVAFVDDPRAPTSIAALAVAL